MLHCDTTQVFVYFYVLFLKPGHWFRHHFLYFWKNFIGLWSPGPCVCEYNYLLLAGRQNRITRTWFVSLFFNVVVSTKTITFFWLVIFVFVWLCPHFHIGFRPIKRFLSPQSNIWFALEIYVPPYDWQYLDPCSVYGTMQIRTRIVMFYIVHLFCFESSALLLIFVQHVNKWEEGKQDA